MSYAPPAWKLGKALKYPGYVVLSPDGAWEVRFVFTTPRESDEISGRQIPGSERVRVGMVSPDDAERTLPIHARLKDRTGGPIYFNYFHSGAPSYLQSNESAVRAAIQRACDEWNDLLQNNAFELTVAIYWDDQLSPSTNAQTDPSSREPRNWTGLRSRLITNALDNFDVNADELDLYGALPLFSIPYRWGTSSSTTTTGITLSLPQLEVLYGYSTGNPIQIAFNPAESKRFTTQSRQFPVLEDQRDFQAIVTHEIGHALGFKSDSEEAQSFFYNYVSAFDLFRFPMTQLGTRAIDSTECDSGERELRIGKHAEIATALDDASKCYVAAVGPGSGDDGIDGDQPGHWGDYAIDSNSYIGIMRGANSPGINWWKNGRYLQLPDVRAIDILGFAVRPSNWIAGPGAATLGSPAANATVAKANLSLTWTSGSGASFDHVSVYDVGADGSRPQVPIAQMENVTGGTFTVAGSLLRPGTEYRWYVAGENQRGSSFADRRFKVSGTACPSDLTNDGLVEDADFSIFVIAYDLIDCSDVAMPRGCRADLNADGFVDDADFSILVVAYDVLVCP
ncbi:MAG: hypothetical protein KF805_14435 [Phycisphaeraceae bacterium]|nr:hypothetical protein [Phycisphaeraceae bacterium]